MASPAGMAGMLDTDSPGVLASSGVTHGETIDEYATAFSHAMMGPSGRAGVTPLPGTGPSRIPSPSAPVMDTTEKHELSAIACALYLKDESRSRAFLNQTRCLIYNQKLFIDLF